VSTWHRVTSSDWHRMSREYMRELRYVHRAWGVDADTRLSDAELLMHVKAPSFLVLVRSRRLGYWSRFVKHAPSSLRNLVLTNCGEISWMSLIIEDLSWLQASNEELSKFPTPAIQSLERWITFACSPRWKKVVKKTVLQESEQEQVIDQPTDNRVTDEVSCEVCQKVCRKGNSIALHLLKVHGYRATYSCFAKSNGECPWCLRGFHNRLRLKGHFRASPKCVAQMHLWRFEQQTGEQISLLDSVDSQFVSSSKRGGLPACGDSHPCVKHKGPGLDFKQGPQQKLHMPGSISAPAAISVECLRRIVDKQPPPLSRIRY
jgi:hypothetical protein